MGFWEAGVPTKTWLTVLRLCVALCMCYMALWIDLLVFKRIYDYSSPHFGWAVLVLLPVSYRCAYTVSAASAACLLGTPALAVFLLIFGCMPAQEMLDFNGRYSENASF